MLQGALSSSSGRRRTIGSRRGVRNLIPTWQYPSPEGQGASDNGFVTLKKDDFHPTLAVGRLPVIQPAEVKAIVDKTIEYMTRPAPGDWRRELTFVSTDEVASYKQESERMASDLGKQGYSIKSLYTKQDARRSSVHANAHSSRTSTAATCSCISSATAARSSGASDRPPTCSRSTT
jgi:hypothetical protein